MLAQASGSKNVYVVIIRFPLMDLTWTGRIERRCCDVTCYGLFGMFCVFWLCLSCQLEAHWDSFDHKPWRSNAYRGLDSCARHTNSRSKTVSPLESLFYVCLYVDVLPTSDFEYSKHKWSPNKGSDRILT